MQKTLFSFLFIAFSSFSIFAQITPQPSPGASISQTVGITEVNIEYSRPGVKGRSIFGGLLPYGQIWRTGANASTKIQFSNDVRINDMPIPAGTYSIMSFPNAQDWTLIFSNDLDVTQENYSEKDDQLRIKVKPYKIDFTETLTIGFSDIHDDNAVLNIAWEHTAISVNVSVNNEETILSAVESKNNEAAGAFQQAAEYLINHNMNPNKALEYIDKSISLKETFRNTWIKSVLMNNIGKKSEALKLAYKAQQLGADDAVYPLFKEAVEKAILELRASVPNGK